MTKVLSKIKTNIYLFLLKEALKRKSLRKTFLDQLEKKAKKALLEDKKFPRAVQEKKLQWLSAFINQGFKNLEKGYVSSSILEKLIEVLGRNNFFRGEIPEIKKAKEAFKEKYGVYPPLFLTLSPTQVCNLRCKGCYAASSPETAVTMPFEIAERILEENHDLFGNRFIVFSGGEPLMYQSQGKTIFDLFAKYPDTFIIFYTNGTLITKEVAQKLAELGNAYPQISVEGSEEETDERRGKGVFQRILKAVSYLREVGLPYALSVTATRKNLKTLLSDEFYHFWFEEQGASYMWIFQLMPIGRGKEVFDLMPTPEERVKLYRKWEELLQRKYPVADFWNSGVLANGCIAYARETSGYFYIDWNGNITPCVFIPYYIDNVYDLYQKGKTLGDALVSDFFKKGREWQRKYGYGCPAEKIQNWLMPCSIRDHYKYFREIILPEEAKGEDQFAEEAKNSKEYFERLVEYDEKLKEITDPIWEKEYKKQA